ncbi:RNA polymerase sigma factor [Armatimonas sp.]|uniref:RNA polymerase sigma factor n=1 Tax=Armatimonas sp. TaxID=1872638 RepID=UPI0037513829
MTLWWLRRPGTVASLSDRDLLNRARSGNSEAIRALLTPHEPLLFRLCLAILGNRADAEDAAQETLLAAIRALPKFRGDAQLSTWLVRIARNICTKRRPAALSLDDAALSVAGPEDAALERVVLQEALAHLTELQRTCLVLQAVEGWSIAEIAQSLSVTQKKVENELYRARKALARWEESTSGNEDGN